MPESININTEHITNEINEIDTIFKDIYNFIIYKISGNWFQNLADYWYSPLADNFSELFIEKTKKIEGVLKTSQFNMISKVIENCNSYLVQAQTPTITINNYLSDKLTIIQNPMKIESNDGLIGMDEKKIEEEIIEQIDTWKTAILNKLNQISSNITIYDINGEIIANIDTEKSKMMEEIITLVKDFSMTIKAELTVEIQNTINTKNKVIENLTVD